MTFDGSSEQLTGTRVTSTLDTPILKGQNLIWCASFLAAWKALQGFVRNPVQFADAAESCNYLNLAQDPREHVPEGCLYAAAGKGIIRTIQETVKRRFPGQQPPTFPGIALDSFVAYAFLEASVAFRIPYFQNRKPLVFVDSGGVKTPVSSFGLRPEDGDAYWKLRSTQPMVLFAARDQEHRLAECVIDLDRTSQPSQILVALTESNGTLAAALASVEDRSRQPCRGYGGLYPADVLLVPDLSWRITHRFVELEGRSFLNDGLEAQRMDIAQQDILFRLNRSGAELKSEMRMYTLGGPTYYLFDRPFLVCLRKREAEHPYFVMWVDNAELLQRFQGGLAFPSKTFSFWHGFKRHSRG